MNINWNEFTISAIGDVVGGGTPSTKNNEYYGDEISWITPKDLSNFNERYISRGERSISQKGYDNSSAQMLPAGTVLFSSRAPIGYVAIAQNELCTNQGFKSVIPHSEVCDSEFLYYLLCYRKHDIEAIASGTTFMEVSGTALKNFVVRIPDISTQKKIAQILSSLDEKIEQNAQINHNLEEQAKALYDQIWDNYDSGTWSSAKAEDLFDISIGKTPPRKESQWFSENDNDIVWVSIADMGQSGCFISNSSEYLTPDAVSKFNVKRVPAGAILLSFKLTVGRVAITGCELTTNEAIAHFRMEDSTIREYLYFYLKHFNYQTMGSTSSIATAVNSKMVKAMRIDIPARETLENFHSTIFPMFEQIKQNQQEIQTLAQLRDTLLPKLMSGELDVSEVEV